MVLYLVIIRARKYIMKNSSDNYWMCDVINDVMGLNANNDYVDDFITLLRSELEQKEYSNRDYSLALQCLSEERIVCFCFSMTLLFVCSAEQQTSTHD